MGIGMELTVCLFFLCLLSVAQISLQANVIQDNVVLSAGLAGEITTITKSSFKIPVLLLKPEGVYLYAAFKYRIYKLTSEDNIPGYDRRPAMLMAENSFNPRHEMIISDDRLPGWVYDGKSDWNRFDKDITIKEDHVLGIKTIRQLYDLASGKEVDVEEITSPLHLFFFSVNQDKIHNLSNEV